jgi:hypothetical protein
LQIKRGKFLFYYHPPQVPKINAKRMNKINIIKKVLLPVLQQPIINAPPLYYINAPNMITNNINNTRAKAAPEIPLPHPHPHPVFIKHSSFLSLHLYSMCILVFCV